MLGLQRGIFSAALEALASGERQVTISGLWGGSKGLFLSSLLAQGHRFAAICRSTDEADALYADLLFFSPLHSRAEAIHLLPAIDLFDAAAPPELSAQRVATLFATLSGDAAALIAPVGGLFDRLPSTEDFLKGVFTLKPGETLSRDEFVRRLSEGGYDFVSAAEVPGEAAIRGGIIDLFPSTAKEPVRVEYFGDQIESLRAYDPETQKSLHPVAEIRVIPARDRRVDISSAPASFFDYLPDPMFYVRVEPAKVERTAGEFLEQVRRIRREGAYLSLQEWENGLANRRMIDLESLVLSRRHSRRVSLGSRSPQSAGFGRRGALFSETLEKLTSVRRDHFTVVGVKNEPQRVRLEKILAEHDVPSLPWSAAAEPPRDPVKGPVYLRVGALSEGFLLPGLLFLTEEELFSKPKVARPRYSRGKGAALGFDLLEDLSVGDYIVHVNYGIGRYHGLKRLSIVGYESEFLVLEYLGRDRLYVPLDSLSLVQKYVGLEGKAPKIDRLGGTAWVKTKARVKGEAKKLAAELLKLYATRETVMRPRYLPEGPLGDEFAAAFEYEETPDQTQAISELFSDMDRPRPMDRLIAGDVGYGKTEVAMRAAFRAVASGRQVAVLVPTTLLAQQHFETFSRRFGPFPVRVDLLSRFRLPKEQKAVVRAVEKGEVDLLIGTHRLLSKDVAFRDLGLLIVDEEHRFGVTQKEKIKQMRARIDVLALSATPIPRTLAMSMMSLRDLSVIETPPPDRLAIRTILAPFDAEVIREAVTRELARGGQVFFIYNRVGQIQEMGRYLSEIVPEARIGIAHGQMVERALEQVMLRFVRHEINLLVSTSIVESGLDIPSANTILIHNADRFGLAELYQLRGRVGRSGEQAYAYLLVPEGARMTSEAEKRLSALAEFSDLGSGFRLAARDLEIRGAGNLLGREQSGQIAAVGFELYTRMIEETVREMRGEAAPAEAEPELSLQVSAFIPEGYLKDTQQRLSLYRRIAASRSPEELAALRGEIADRFGSPPLPLECLFEVMAVKIAARRLKLAKVHAGGGTIRIEFLEGTARPTGEVDRLLTSYPGRIHFIGPYAFETLSSFPRGEAKEWEATRSEIFRLFDLLRIGQ